MDPEIRVRYVFLCEEFDAANYNSIVGQYLDLLQLFTIWGPFKVDDYMDNLSFSDLETNKAPIWQFRITSNLEKSVSKSLIKEKIQYLLDFGSETSEVPGSVISLIEKPNFSEKISLSNISYQITNAIESFLLPDEKEQERILDACFSRVV